MQSSSRVRNATGQNSRLFYQYRGPYRVFISVDIVVRLALGSNHSLELVLYPWSTY